MVRGRQLDPALRARIFELRAAGNGAKRIHKLLPDVPFNTIKTTLRRSKTAATSAASVAGDTTSRLHPGSDESPSPLPALDGHRDVDVGAALAGHSLKTAAAGPNNPLAPLASLHRGLPGALPPQQVSGVVKQQQSHHQSQQQQHQQHQQQQHQQHQQQQQQQQQQQRQQQKQQHHQTASVGAPQLPRPSGNIAPTLPGDPQTRRARDLINEIDILPGASSSSGTNGVPSQTLDLERLKSEYRAMPDAQRLAAENELDMRKAALVTAKWEVQRELDAARRQAQIDQLQALQQEGLDPETFYVRFRQLVQPSNS